MTGMNEYWKDFPIPEQPVQRRHDENGRTHGPTRHNWRSPPSHDTTKERANWSQPITSASSNTSDREDRPGVRLLEARSNRWCSVVARP